MIRSGVCITNFGTYADVGRAVAAAEAAEANGWDGFFVWDHLSFVWGPPSADPWVVLAAAAASTQRIRLGTAVAVVPRYRPHLLAQTTATLDRLSGGRLVLGVGIGGSSAEDAAFGDTDDRRTRASMLDEGLEVVTRLWSGSSAEHAGAHYRVNGVALGVVPAQRPRIPIWVGGNSPASLRRAARWDGWIADTAGESEMRMSPEEVAKSVARIREQRGEAGPFDVTAMGYAAGVSVEMVKEYEDAGATWWLEVFHDRRGDFDLTLRLTREGPPD
jgi:probable F420-dependent oxidoreductase